jgi:hypothetical protein
MHLWFVLQVGSNEHDDSEELVQGICAFLMGICISFNDDTVSTFSKVRLAHKMKFISTGCSVFAKCVRCMSVAFRLLYVNLTATRVSIYFDWYTVLYIV